MPRFLIVDDHELLRRGLKALLEEAFPLAEVGEATDGSRAVAAAQESNWDAVVLDLQLPGRSGLEILAELRAIQPNLPVIVFSASPERDYAVRAYKLGAVAYLSKQRGATELIVALRRALDGGRYVPPELVESIAAAVAGDAPAAPHESLSNRELDVLCRLARGATQKEVAAALSLSEKTIETYRTRISRKMGLSTNVELTRYAVQNKLID